MRTRTDVDAHISTEPPLLDRIIRSRELQKILNVSAATLHRMRQRGELPEPLRISAGAVGWRQSTIDRWLDEREREAAGHEAA